MNYGIKLKEIRENNNYTQKDIAQKLGISRSTYKDYELQIRIIPIKHVINLCNILNISIDYLFDLTNTTNYQNKSTTNNIIIGSRLKEFRKTENITQEKLAESLNTTHSVISEIENNKKLIATPFLYTICNKYKISADYLLGTINYKPNLDI